jgi:hypothetical protein
MRFRKLRIAWSVSSALAALLLAVLWARSYWVWHNIVWGLTPKQGVLVNSSQGHLECEYLDLRNMPLTLVRWRFQTGVWSGHLCLAAKSHALPGVS